MPGSLLDILVVCVCVSVFSSLLIVSGSWIYVIREPTEKIPGTKISPSMTTSQRKNIFFNIHQTGAMLVW